MSLALLIIVIGLVLKYFIINPYPSLLDHPVILTPGQDIRGLGLVQLEIVLAFYLIITS